LGLILLAVVVAAAVDEAFVNLVVAIIIFAVARFLGRVAQAKVSRGSTDFLAARLTLRRALLDIARITLGLWVGHRISGPTTIGEETAKDD
jgi:hypothetical protein